MMIAHKINPVGPLHHCGGELGRSKGLLLVTSQFKINSLTGLLVFVAFCIVSSILK